jgi:hypothetical protein
MTSYNWDDALNHNLGTWFDALHYLGRPDSYYAEVWATSPRGGSTLVLGYERGVVVEGPLSDSEQYPARIPIEPAGPVVSVLLYDTARVSNPGSMREKYPWTGLDRQEDYIVVVFN